MSWNGESGAEMEWMVDCYAGSNVLPRIREEGFDWNRVRVVLGAAGGPKWLVLAGLDEVLCRKWLPFLSRPVDFVGSSIGAWRFAAYCRNDPEKALADFLDAYFKQRYSLRPTPIEINEVLGAVLDGFISGKAQEEIVSQPMRRLHVMAVRSRGILNTDRRLPLSLGLGAAYAVNAIHRRGIFWFFQRVLFRHPKGEVHRFLRLSECSPLTALLDASNLKSVLLASGSIPLLMPGIDRIPGAPPGVYRDGGLVDYHLTFPFRLKEGEIVFYPHYGPRLVPGWFDKPFPSRRPPDSHLANVFMVTPSRKFAEQLPYGRIPARRDFWTFAGRDGDRIRYWSTVVDRSRMFGAAFWEMVRSGTVRSRVRPMDALFSS